MTGKLSRLQIFSFIFGFSRGHRVHLMSGVLLYISQSITFPLFYSMLFAGITNAIMDTSFETLLRTALQVTVLMIPACLMLGFGVPLYITGALKVKKRIQIKMLRSFMNNPSRMGNNPQSARQGARTGSNPQSARQGARTGNADIQEHVHSGEQLSKLNTDVNAAHDLYSNSLSQMLMCLVPAVSFSIAIFAMQWQLGIYTLIAGLLSAVVQVMFAKPLARIATLKLGKIAGVTKTLGDVFAGGSVLRVFGLNKRILGIFARDNDELLKLINREANINGAQGFFTGITGFLTYAGIYAFGGVLISQDLLTLPILMAIAPLTETVGDALTRIGTVWAQMQTPLEAGQRIYDTLGGDNSLPPLEEEQSERHSLLDEESHSTGAAAPGYGKFNIVIKDLTLTYKDNDKPIFEGVNLLIEENQFAAFIGESGGGKSTLLKVIAGLHECEGLNLAVGDKNFGEMPIALWRRFFAYVDQSCTLFDLTIAENIALGKAGATLDDIKAAAVEAGADGFISQLPDGYDTKVGEAGASLSGGQKQRISIARALLRRSPVLVLDEVTSALDKESAADVLDTIRGLRGKHTILMVTHDIESIEPDVTYLVGGGKVVVA